VIGEREANPFSCQQIGKRITDGQVALNRGKAVETSKDTRS